jgi:hypothetical protein
VSGFSTRVCVCLRSTQKHVHVMCCVAGWLTQQCWTREWCGYISAHTPNTRHVLACQFLHSWDTLTRQCWRRWCSAPRASLVLFPFEQQKLHVDHSSPPYMACTPRVIAGYTSLHAPHAIMCCSTMPAGMSVVARSLAEQGAVWRVLPASFVQLVTVM